MDILGFAFSALVIVLAGTRLSAIADHLADRTGLGEALMGGVFLGATTSISGSVLSATAAWEGLTDLAISNAIGGIAVQTFFLVLVDIWYRGANLEHAAVSTTNTMLAGLLALLLTLPLIAQAVPAVTFVGIHPVTLILFLTYLGGLRYVAEERRNPMWEPRHTRETVEDTPEAPTDGAHLGRLWLQFTLLAALMVGAGLLLKTTGVSLAREWGLTHMVLGTLLTAITTSLPELVTTFAAVRRGALTLAIGGIVGGNSFDVLFLAFADIAYRDGSLYHTMTHQHLAYIALIIAMIIVLMLGLLRREKSGIANIGWESVLIGLLYLASLGLVVSGGP